MQALKGSTWCWNHDPTSAAARAEARQRGAATTNGRRPAPHPELLPAAALPPAFDLSDLQRSDDVGPTLLRLARAIAGREVDVRTGRVLIEAIRAAQIAFEFAPDAAVTGMPLDAREPTRKEIAYLKMTGRLPPGVVPVHDDLWLRGSVAAEFQDDESDARLAPRQPPPPRRRRKPRRA
jgi:hypothetical protein